MRFYRGFGAVSETGKNCPVPEQSWYSIPGPNEINPYCDCMYENKAVRDACKTPIDILKPSTWGAPWTALGKANRSLPGSPQWLNSALQAAATQGEKAVSGVISGNLPNVGPTGLLTPRTDTTPDTLPPPAGPGGPIGTTGTTPQTRFRLPVGTADRFRTAREVALAKGADMQMIDDTRAQRQIIIDAMKKLPPPDFEYRDEPKSGALPLVAAGIAAFLLLR